MSEDAFVEVTGYGAATTTPDRVRLQVAAVAKAPSVGDAFTAAESGLTAMLAAAREHGVADEDLRSTHVDVQLGRRGRGTGPGFRASMGIEITVHDVSAAGRVLAAVVDAGGDRSRVHGMSLDTTAPEEALADARAAAWGNALDRARQYARLSARDLGVVVRVSEEPQVHGYAKPALAAGAAFASFPVEPGSHTCGAAITVRWQLL